MNPKREIRILVVEDEEFSQDILQYYLSECGFFVSIANDIDSARQYLEDGQTFDMILIDRVLQSADGLDFVRKIRGDERFKDLPIVVEFALAMPDQVLEGLEAGANYYLTKPYSLPLLCEAIQSAFDWNMRKNNICGSAYGRNCTSRENPCPWKDGPRRASATTRPSPH